MHLVSFALVLVVSVSLADAAGGLKIPMIERLEVITYGARLRVAIPGGVDTRIAIVVIDAKSLSADAC